jgi:hypothetical protein
VPVPPDYLAPSDLVAATSQAVVDRFFDDDGDGAADVALVARTIANVMSAIDTMLLKSWSPAAIVLLSAEPLFKMHAAFMVLHMGAKRRYEWRDAQGNAPFRTDWNDAQKYFDALSKGDTRAAREDVAGRAPAIGGNLIMPQGNAPSYVFTPDPNNRDYRGRGGY